MLDAILTGIYSGFPILALHFITTLAVFAFAVVIYFRITTHNELAQSKNGNTAASIAASGVMIGLALPLGFCLAGSVGVIDIILWGVIALIMQIASYLVVDRFIFPGISKQIDEKNVAAAIFLSGVKISIGIINAAAFAI